MVDPESIVFALPAEGYWLPTYNAVIVTIPWDVRSRVSLIVDSYMMAYDMERIRGLLSGRTVAQVLAEFVPPLGRAVVESGTVDGVGYNLYAPLPNGDATHAEPDVATGGTAQ